MEHITSMHSLLHCLQDCIIIGNTDHIFNENRRQGMILKQSRNKQERQCTYNTEACSQIIVAMEKQYYIFVCVCVQVDAKVHGRVHTCSLAYPAYNMYVPCCDIICGLSGSITLFNITS
jgi:hypothetical protein